MSNGSNLDANSLHVNSAERNSLAHLEGRIDEIAAMIRQVEERQRLNERLLRQQIMSASTPLSNNRILTRICTGDELFVDDRDVGSGLRIIRQGKIELNVMRFMRKLLLPGTVFLDIGANFGFYSVFAASQMRNGGKVYAFEANPFLKNFIETSAFINALSNRITLINKAVSDHEGMAQFGFSFSGIGGGSLTQGPQESHYGNQIITVPLTTIDNEVPNSEVVACAKIDVEGSELAALRGMEKVIHRSPAIVIVLEFFPGLHRKDRGAEILRFLETVGLQYWRIDGVGRLEDATFEALVNGEDCYLAAARERPNDRTLTISQTALKLGRRDGEGRLVGAPGETLVNGPYWYLPQGRYDIRVVGEVAGEIQAYFTQEFGFHVVTAVLAADRMSFPVDLIEDVRYFEVVLRSMGDSTKLRLDRIEVNER